MAFRCHGIDRLGDEAKKLRGAAVRCFDPLVSHTGFNPRLAMVSGYLHRLLSLVRLDPRV